MYEEGETMLEALESYIYSQIHVDDVITTRFDKTLILNKNDEIQSLIVLWKNGVVECRIESKTNSYYYLHFDNTTLDRAIELINDFLSFRDDFYNKEAIHVLICCSSGFTSSLLVDGLNRIVHEMNYPMTIEFGSCFKIDQEDEIYDLILLAPQIAHMETTINKICKTKVIPTNIYGASNYHALLNFIFNHII